MPQQLAVDISNGTELKVIGTKLRFEKMLKGSTVPCVVFLDLKNAQNEYRRKAAPDALLRTNAADLISPAMASLARAREADSGQPGAIFARSSRGARGYTFLCDGVAGGPQGCPLANLFFPMTIDLALKETMSRYDGVEIKAIQDDIGLSGDPAIVLGKNGALAHLLGALETQVDLKPNHAEF